MSQTGNSACTIDEFKKKKDKDKSEFQLEFNRRAGASGFSGQLYEIALLMLLILESSKRKNKTKSFSFHLATNMEEGGDFDDVVYVNNYKNKDGEDKSQIFFLQAKHKNSKQDKITLDKLLSDSEKGDFLLKKYFSAFRQIKKYFYEEKSYHPVFSSDFRNCDFIIYTNATLEGERKQGGKNISEEKLHQDNMLFLEECDQTTNIYYKLNLDGSKHGQIISVLENSSDCKKLAKELSEAIFSKNGIDLDKGIVKYYQTPLTSDVFEMNSHGEAKLRSTFLINQKCQLSKAFLEEAQKLKEFVGKSTDEVRSELSTMNIKLFQQKRESDPLVVLPSDLVNDGEINDFISVLQLFFGQPNEESLCEAIKKKIISAYCLEKDEASFIFADVKTKVEKWWKEGTHFLNESNTLFQDSVRFSIKFNVREPAQLFTGRQEELDRLHKKIQRSSERVTVISQMTSISGLGGIGKTELARQYIKKFEDDFDGNIVWINAENEQTYIESFRRLAREKLRINMINIDGKEKNIKSVVEEVYKFFIRRKSLFIFDNAEKNDTINMFLPLSSIPSGGTKPHILITSRNQEWERGIEVLKLEVLKLQEAIEFVKKGLNIIKDDLTKDTEIEALVVKLQYFPLAIQQAIAYIVDQKEIGVYGIYNYLTEFENQTEHLLNTKEFRGIDNGYAKTTFTTWKLTIEKIKKVDEFGKLAVDILNAIAYFSPERIYRDTFSKLSGNDEAILKSAVRLLVKFSMVNGEEKQSVLYIHRLVQEVTRIDLRRRGQEEQIIRNCVDLVNINAVMKNVDHAISTWGYAKKYPNIIKDNSKMSSDIVSILNDCVRLEEGYIFGNEALQLLENLLEENHLDALSLKHNIASVLQSQGKFKEAHEEYTKVIGKISVILGEDHPHTLSARNNIAKSLQHLGKFKEALTAFKEVLERQNKSLGQTHEDTLVTRQNIAEVLGILGKYDEALKIYIEILTIKNIILDNDHPSTLSTKHNIAVILENQDNFSVAQEAYNDIIKSKTKVLGHKHLSTMATNHNAAGLLAMMGKFEDALKIYNEVLEVRNKLLGPKHRDTLATENNIALVLISQGKYEEALCALQDVLEKMTVVLGSDHPDSLTTRNNKGVVLEKQGKYNEALDIYNYVLDQRIYILGIDHHDTLITRNNIAVVLENQGNYNEALKEMEEILKIKIKILGENNLSTLITKNNLAGILESLGRYGDAYNTYKDVLNKRTEILGAENPDTLTTKNNLALTLIRLGRNEEALTALTEVLEKQYNVISPRHIDYWTTKHNIARVLAQLGKDAEAIAEYKQVIIEKSKILGEFHPEVLTSTHNMANILKKTEKYDDALQQYKDVHSKRMIVLGPKHPDTLVTLQYMAGILESQCKYDDALATYRELLVLQYENSAEENLSSLTTKNSIAKVLKAQRKYNEALEMYQEIHEKIKNILGSDDEITLIIKHNLATVLELLGKCDDALHMHMEILHQRNIHLGPNNEDTLLTKHCIEKLQSKKCKDSDKET